MEQHLPCPTWSDIERILHREFSWDRAEQLIALIDMYDVRKQTREIAACLKNSSGDFQTFCNSLFHAQVYWHEEVAQAEYPRTTRQISKGCRLCPQEKAALIEMDKEEYNAWFYGE